MNYVFSLHFFPCTLSAVLAVALYGWWEMPYVGFLLLAVGGLSVAVAFWLQPWGLHMRPIGGRYYVGIRELPRGAGKDSVPLTVFYPTRTPPAPSGIPWLPFSDTRFLKGLAAYVSLPAFFTMDLQTTRTVATMDCPGLPMCMEEGGVRPVLLFSHGLASFPRLYTTFFLDLAARGAVVVAMAHMDGSGAFCRDSTNEPDSTVLMQRNVTETLPYRETQLGTRVAEIRATLARWRSGDILRLLQRDAAEIAAYQSHNAKVALLGHSFGGATVLSAGMEIQSEDPDILAGVVAYDPWFFPLQERHFWWPLSQGGRRFSLPTLQFHSEQWIRFKENWDFFHKVHTLLEESNTKTLESGRVPQHIIRMCPRVGHLSFCDVVLLSPFVFSAGYRHSTPRALSVERANETLRFVTANMR